MTDAAQPPQKKKRLTLLVVGACALAAPCEGIYHTFYYDPPGIPTVCMGHTGPDVDKRKRYTDAECQALLTADMTRAVQTVERCHPGLPEKVAIAFGDAVFNMGPTIACDQAHSTAARYLAANDFTAACLQLTRWDKARVHGVMIALPGLTKRRALERDVCLQWKDGDGSPD